MEKYNELESKKNLTKLKLNAQAPEKWRQKF